MIEKMHLDQNHALMVDSFCELPYSIFEKKEIGLIENQIHNAKKNIFDNRETELSIEYYNNNFNDSNHAITNLGYSKLEFKNYLLNFINHMAIIGSNPTTLHIQHSSSSHIHPFDTFIREIHKIYLDPTSEFHERITSVLRNPKFSIRIYDTRQVFTGQGLCALYSQDKFKEKIYLSAFRKDFNTFSQSIKTYSIPSTRKYCDKNYSSQKIISEKIKNYFFKNNGKLPILLFKNGEDYVFDNTNNHSSALKSILLKMKSDLLNYKSLSKHICVSYGGDIEEFKSTYKTEYNSILAICDNLHFKPHFSTSSISTGINLGTGHINISYSSVE